MKLASFDADGTTSYGIVVDGGIVDLRTRLGARHADLKSLLAADALADAAAHSGDAPDHAFADVRWQPVISNPSKIVCVGLNYEDHRIEAGLDPTEHPALFLRTPDSQVAHSEPIVRPRESATLDFEAEIAVVIGRAGRRIDPSAAWDHIAGYSCYNDGSVREWQRHTLQYTAGKNFPSTGGFGPWLVTADQVPPSTVMTLSCRVNGDLVQQATTEQMIFGIPELLAYISTVWTLVPGDVIVTGTPAGVGSRRTPPVWLVPGDSVAVEIDKVGTLVNGIVDD